MRGIVSLAAALAIPLTMDDGRPFPDRDLILFLTYTIILVTLVGQGLLLPALIRALGLENAGRREHRAQKAEELEARREAIAAATERLEALSAEGRVPADLALALRAQNRERLRHFEPHGAHGDAGAVHGAPHAHDSVELALLAAERERINALYRAGHLRDETRRRLERELDLRDASIAGHEHDDMA